MVSINVSIFFENADEFSAKFTNIHRMQKISVNLRKPFRNFLACQEKNRFFLRRKKIEKNAKKCCANTFCVLY